MGFLGKIKEFLSEIADFFHNFVQFSRNLGHKLTDIFVIFARGANLSHKNEKYTIFEANIH